MKKATVPASRRVAKAPTPTSKVAKVAAGKALVTKAAARAKTEADPSALLSDLLVCALVRLSVCVSV